MTDNTSVLLLGFGTLFFGMALSVASANDSNMADVIKARDSGDVQTLQQMITEARTEAQQANSAPAYEKLAQLQSWLYEAAHCHQNDELAKQSAQDGISAAEKAVALNPNSSEARRLHSELLGEAIPYTTMGGPRFGPASTREADKAIELDSKNPHAYIARAIDYIYSPAMFGGSKEKAEEFLRKALALDPNSDTAHLWLAQVYQAEGKHDEALREINEALRLDPERGFSKFVLSQINGRRQAATL